MPTAFLYKESAGINLSGQAVELMWWQKPERNGDKLHKPKNPFQDMFSPKLTLMGYIDVPAFQE